jgi:hypothetical protein
MDRRLQQEAGKPETTKKNGKDAAVMPFLLGLMRNGGW